MRRLSGQEDELLEAEELEGGTELYLRMWVDGPYRDGDEVDQSIRGSVGEMQSLAFSHLEADGVTVEPLDPPAIGHLCEISVPTLVITGELDVPVFVHLGETVAHGILPLLRLRHQKIFDQRSAIAEARDQPIRAIGKARSIAEDLLEGMMNGLMSSTVASYECGRSAMCLPCCGSDDHGGVPYSAPGWRPDDSEDNCLV